MKKLEIIDISVLVREDPDNYVKEVPIIPIGGDIFNGFRINLNVHYGTHMDAPCHRNPYTKTIEQYPLERFILPAVVIESMDPVLSLIHISAGRIKRPPPEGGKGPK